MNEVNHSLDRLAAATDRVLATATTLSDAEAREPSLLPGWSRGHVLTHIARNADSFRLGPDQAGTPAVIIKGEAADMLAWLLGRSDGARLTMAGGGTLPELPPWR
jgi:uncharacterized damage-inducible protein DinB